ncbi:MAG: RNA polymerase sigma factor RpoH [Alphaproteobacteria bacterium]|nr:RNA polymerase sigma factor RpoH [Alphaproteobacteria bacterium]MDY4689607.1 RNA polymerase sigma factor RpoH [Alphaproteobacteria bacterium]
MSNSEHKDIVVYEPKTNLPVLSEENGLHAYLETIRKFPVLSEEEENHLLREFKENGDLAAAQKLITSHLRLAVKIALTYRRYGLPAADLISEANIGLMQAVKKFDINKNVRLSTYAILWIKAALNDFVLRSWSLVKIGTVAAQKKLFYNLGRIKARLGIYENKELEPSVVKQIAQELVVDEKDVIEMNQRIGGDTSLNTAAHNNDDEQVEKIDLLADKTQNIEGRLEQKQEAEVRRKILLSCLAKLNEREQYIVKNRMLTDSPQTLEDIGAKFNISRERVRQIEKKAFEKLSSEVKAAMSAAA